MTTPDREPLPLPAGVVQQHADWAREVVWRNEAGGVTYRLVGPAGEVRFAKVAPRDMEPSIEDEVRRLRWAFDHLPVPRVIAAGEDGDVAFMVTAGLRGTDASKPAMVARPAWLVDRLGKALRRFHEAPVDACPFDFRIDGALDHVARRVADGLVDAARHLHDEFAHHTPATALAELRETQPPSEDLVVCHGDFCLPNVLFDAADGALTGYLDLGELGVADRWWDLAIATWSATWNLGPGYEDALLDAYGIDRDDARIRWYRLLYDLAS